MRARAILWLVLMLVLAVLLAACSAAGGGDKGEEIEENAGGPEALDGGFVWQRVGGIAGFCDVVTVGAGGPATAASCASEPPETLGETTLTAAQAQQVAGWVARLASFEHEQSDPATADAMTITITFTGRGDEQPTDADIAAIEGLAVEVLRAVAAR